MAAYFHLSVVTPERVVLEIEALFVALPAWDGEIGILRRRAPLLCKLDVGRLRVETATGEKRELYVDGGFAEMVGDRLTVLTEEALEPAKLEREGAKKLLKEARAMTATDDASFAARQRALKRARVQLRMLGRPS